MNVSLARSMGNFLKQHGIAGDSERPLRGEKAAMNAAARKVSAFVGAIALAGAVIFAAGCQSASAPKDYAPTSARFFLESADADGTPLTLPQSGVHVTVNSTPVIVESDIVNVELVQVDLGKCLLFQLSPSATRDFYRLSVTHLGRRLVVLVNGAPLGARRIDGVIANGAVFVFVEVPETALPALVDNLKKSSMAVQRELARKG